MPFFGVPAATLIAPSRLARSLGMAVQPVVARMLPGGQGYVVTYLPPLDMIAFFPDGSMRALYGNEYTAEQLLGMGVDNTLSFGPVLLRGGELGQQVDVLGLGLGDEQGLGHGVSPGWRIKTPRVARLAERGQRRPPGGARV